MLSIRGDGREVEPPAAAEAAARVEMDGDVVDF